MRSLGFAAVIFLCSGCATVSMQPASMTTSFSAPQSELSKASDAFCEMLESRGWVASSSPFALLQRSFFSSQADQTSDTEVYFDKVAAKTDRVDLVEGRIVRDIDTVRASLSDVNEIARSFIADHKKATRSDVSSFEEALVQARKSRRAFEAADNILTERNSAQSSLTTGAFEAFDAEIERSKSLADALVASWRDDNSALS
eukprot:m.464675 g.464675  ORF g.464675 m.464675 type:complete len:201 (+) comp23664_c0_seq1:96-698(+)